MTTVGANWKKLFLDSLLWEADSANVSFFAILKTAAQAKLKIVGDGAVLVGTSENGASVTYQIPAGGPGPSEMVGVIADLFDLYNRKKQALGGAPDDAVLVQAMKDALVPVRRYSTDFRGIVK